MRSYYMKAGLLILLLAVSCNAQTTSELRQKYGKPFTEGYLVRPDIVAIFKFAQNGEACEMTIEPRKVSGSNETSDSSERIMASGIVDELIDELAPDVQRGRLLNQGDFESSRIRIFYLSYEHAMISRVTLGGETASVTIKWTDVKCQ